MWWYLFQGLVMFAVIGTNIHFHWTPNPLIPAALGYGVAFALTAGLCWLFARPRTGRIHLSSDAGGSDDYIARNARHFGYLPQHGAGLRIGDDRR